jgi:NAD(P)-dependent dehydrogenase (short-subunit alcohol dehydrogenase family)
VESSLSFKGKVALVTGGASGLGAQCVRLLIERGAKVTIVDRDRKAAEDLAAQFPGAALAFEADVSDPEQCELMVRTCLADFGQLDVALNIAGIVSNLSQSIHEVDPELWRRIQSVNIDGVFYSMRAEIPALLARGGGSIVNMTSTLGIVGMGGSGPYCASKHAVVGLTRSTAVEYGKRGIRVNAVAPGVTLTAQAEAAKESYSEIFDHLQSLHPIGRFGKPNEIAELITFLASEAASFCTGGVYVADGGYTAV